MSTILNEVATPVATLEENTPNQTQKIFERYNWEEVKEVIADQYHPSTIAYALHRCLVRYVLYLLADPDVSADDEAVQQIAILDFLHSAVSGLAEDAEEEEQEEI